MSPKNIATYSSNLSLPPTNGDNNDSVDGCNSDGNGGNDGRCYEECDCGGEDFKRR